MRVVLLAILAFEVILFGLAIPVMILVSDVRPARRRPLRRGSGPAGAGRRRADAPAAGYPLGWLTQLVGLALGLLTTAMYVVGGLFLALWLITFILGRRLDEQGRTRPA